MQCDFCELGTADTLEYHSDEFQAFYLVTEHCVSSVSVGHRLFSEVARCTLSWRPEKQHHPNWTYLICLPPNATFLVCVINVSDICMLTDLVSTFLKQ